MECPSCKTEIRPGSLFCHHCGKTLDEIIPVDDKHSMSEVPVCDYCGRQDHTLRYVVFPFVVSFILFTHRDAFRGVMCKKHRNLYWVLASLITATIGWIGIPFGIIFTPVALFQLALGGNQPKDRNIQMLKSLSKHKDSQGDTVGAIKCLEACLRFGDDDEAQREIQQYRLRQGIAGNEIRLWTKIFSTLALLLGAAMIGAIIGVLDYSLTYALSVIFQGEIPNFVDLLSWTTLVTPAFIGGLALSQLIEWAITRTVLRNRFVAVGLCGLSALIAAYSIAQGQMMGEYIYLLVGRAFESALDATFAGGVLAVIGGFLWIQYQLEEPTTASIILLILMTVIIVYYLLMAIRAALKTMQWLKRLAPKDSIFSD